MQTVSIVTTELYSSCQDAELHDQLAPRGCHQRRRTVRSQGVATGACPVPRASPASLGRPSSDILAVGRRRRVQRTQRRLVQVARQLCRWPSTRPGRCRSPRRCRRRRRGCVHCLSIYRLLRLIHPRLSTTSQSIYVNRHSSNGPLLRCGGVATSIPLRLDGHSTAIQLKSLRSQ